MKRLLLSLLVALLAGCSGSGGAAGSGAGSAGKACPNHGHHAFVVVAHLDGRVVQRCVSFSGSEISGQRLMQDSGLAFEAKAAPLGKTMCRVDGEPAAAPSCGPGWTLFQEAGGSAWLRAQSPYDLVAVRDGDALGWRYATPGATPAPPPLPPRV